jgi:hypothetical protein
MKDEEKEEVEMEDVAKTTRQSTRLVWPASQVMGRTISRSLSMIKDLWILSVRLILKSKKKTGGGTRRKRLNLKLHRGFILIKKRRY